MKQTERIQKLQERGFGSDYYMTSLHRCVISRFYVLLIVSILISQTTLVSALIFPGLQPTPCVHTGITNFENMKQRNNSLALLAVSPLRKSSTAMFANTENDENREVQEKFLDKKPKLNRMGKFGSRMLSTFRSNRNIKTSDENETTADNTSSSTIMQPSKERSKTPIISPNIIDPFQSEIALANELKKQKALDNYVSGSTESIPDEFLPRETKGEKGEALGIDQALSTLDDSISFVRNKLGSIRLNEDDETNSIFLTPKKEEQRLNQIRKDLEVRREKLVVEEKKRMKELKQQENVQATKRRMAAARAKRDKEIKGIGLANSSPLDNEDKLTNEENGINSSTPKSRKIVDGLMSSAQSIGNAWKAVRSKTKTDKNQDEWITVCPKTRISPGEVYPVVAGGLDLLIIGSKDGTKVHCISNICPHLGTPLETGMVERKPCPKRAGPSSKSNGLCTGDNMKIPVDDGYEECIVCPLHNTAFALDTGEVRGEWCPYPPIIGKVMGQVKSQNNLTTFQMRSRGKMLQIKISSAIPF